MRGPLVREVRPRYRRVSGQVVAVRVYTNGGYSLLWPHGTEHHGASLPSRTYARYRQAYTVFEVLTGRRVTTFEMVLPARGDTEFFNATVRVHWEVEDPYAVVRNQVWDAADLLRDELHDELRGVSRRFPLTASQQADEAVRNALNVQQWPLGRDLGLRTRVHVHIDLSERVREQVRLGTELDLRRRLAEKEHSLRQREEDQETQLVRRRAQEFEEVLRRGDISAIAAFMARNPEKALEIQQLFYQQRQEQRGDWLHLITKLIEGGQLERHDIGTHMYEVLKHLRDASAGVAGASAEALFDRTTPVRPELGQGEPAPTRRWPFWEDGAGARAARSDRGGAGAATDPADPIAGQGGEPVRDAPPTHEPSVVESSAEQGHRASRATGDDAGADRGDGP
ncbi:hypothetical protein AQ490_19885 [Wenjunlia vitaminophila]|uniref:Band 7 domain-containing protein n=1 Tax=Wenjunlia vitaminophila TaxID=76728 RepID=A0A0T6LUE5_WENVI|nr:hypothetical protein [Wenjunlia vitaminophila]KRV49585.1 hypothetical protein AQ490_19885 [Wenjunlia vitaminophila]